MQTRPTTSLFCVLYLRSLSNSILFFSLPPISPQRVRRRSQECLIRIKSFSVLSVPLTLVIPWALLNCRSIHMFESLQCSPFSVNSSTCCIQFGFYFDHVTVTLRLMHCFQALYCMLSLDLIQWLSVPLFLVKQLFCILGFFVAKYK